MSKKRILLLLVVGFGIGLLVVRLLRPPAPTIPAQALPPPAVERPKAALQSDAEGQYVPGYGFSVGRFRFTGFSLRPDALVTFASGASGAEEVATCEQASISAASFHLRCESLQVGIITIEGRFLTRVVTTRLDTPVVSAVVTVRTRSGDVLYSARDSFVWQAGR